MGSHPANFGLPMTYVLELCRGTRQTDRQTNGQMDRRTYIQTNEPIYNAPPLRGGLAWWDWPFTWWTDQLFFVLCHCWLGHLTRKNRSQYDL